MATSAALADALKALVAPLSFAARGGFAGLAKLKDFEGTVRAAVERARKAGDAGAAGLLDGLSREGDAFDAQPLDERKKRVARLAGLLAMVPLTLPEELGGPAAQLSLTGLPPPAPKATAKPAPAQKMLELPLPDAPPATPLELPLAGLGARHVVDGLRARGIKSAGDLLYFLPRRYEDRRDVRPIGTLLGGASVVAVGTIQKMGAVFKGRRRAYEMVIGDGSGTIRAQWWRFTQGMFKKYAIGARVIVSGEVREHPRFGKSLSHPDLELIGADTDDALETAAAQDSFGRIIPIYTDVEGVSQRALRRLVRKAVEAAAPAIVDPLPQELREKRELLSAREALTFAHFPPDDTDLRVLDGRASPAHRRLVYEELFLLQCGLALKKRGVKIEPGIAFKADDAAIARAASRLPFKLTNAQRRALGQIAADMAKSEPMNRLLQGDVGSGKTAVALCAALLAIESGYQAALMAPTELLAEQHHRNLSKLLEGTGVRCALVTGSLKARAREDADRALRTGYVQLAIGTHALAEEATRFSNLGLVVVDEQHRFGVLQRASLINKGARPDVLVMTATPIPRTLAMTVYGDLDASVIDELPPGRTPIVTRVYGEKQRAKAYELVRGQLAAGRQAYFVLPLVEESEKLVDIKDAIGEHERLARDVFPEFRLGLVHGRLSAEERDAVMDRFRSGEVQLLVATTVIEVGVDVPNASVMVVEHAERFGLSQLHQLRGRVGRGAAKSLCLLLAGYAQSAVGRERLAVMEATTDGFRIAEEDLRLRGMGELVGTRQSGMPDLAVADLARDQAILQDVRDDAFALIAADPELLRPEHRALARALYERWAGKLSLARVG